MIDVTKALNDMVKAANDYQRRTRHYANAQVYAYNMSPALYAAIVSSAEYQRITGRTNGWFNGYVMAEDVGLEDDVIIFEPISIIIQIEEKPVMHPSAIASPSATMPTPTYSTTIPQKMTVSPSNFPMPLPTSLQSKPTKKACTCHVSKLLSTGCDCGGS